jgi:hypothetical protein
MLSHVNAEIDFKRCKSERKTFAILLILLHSNSCCSCCCRCCCFYCVSSFSHFFPRPDGKEAREIKKISHSNKIHCIITQCEITKNVPLRKFNFRTIQKSLSQNAIKKSCIEREKGSCIVENSKRHFHKSISMFERLKFSSVPSIFSYSEKVHFPI